MWIGNGFGLETLLGHLQSCDLSGCLDTTATQQGRLLSHCFIPGLGKALWEHTHLIMQEITEWGANPAYWENL